MCTSVAGSLGGWCFDLACHNWRVHCGGMSYHTVRGGATSPHRSNSRHGRGPGARQRQSQLGKWVATELRLNNCDNRVRSRRQLRQTQRRYSGWVATAMHMQGQENCLLDEPPDPGKQQRRSRRGGYRQYQTNQVQWRLPLGGNRTPLKGVTVRPLHANTLGLQTIEQS